MIYQSVFGWISTIFTILCFAWVIGLLIFVLIRWIIQKVKFKKEQKELINTHEKQRAKRFGYDDKRRKGSK